MVTSNMEACKIYRGMGGNYTTDDIYDSLSLSLWLQVHPDVQEGV